MINWIANHWLKCLFLLCLFFTLIVPSMLAFLGKAAEAGIVAAVGLLCMAFTQLDKFAEFSGLGFRGKMREMEQAKNEAYASIEAIRELADALTRLSMESLIAIGMGGGRSWKIGLDLRHKIHGILQEKLNMSKIKADEAVNTFDKNMETLLAERIKIAIFRIAEPDEDMRKKIVGNSSIINHSTLEVAANEIFERFAKEFDVAEDPNVIESIEDLKYYRKYREFRRPELAEICG